MKETKINIKQALTDKLNGKSMRSIAKDQDCALSTLQHQINPIMKALESPEDLAKMRDELANRCLSLAHRSICSVTDGELQKASVKDRGILGGVMIDKFQILNGHPTSIVDVQLRGLIAHLDLSHVTEMDTECIDITE